MNKRNIIDTLASKFADLIMLGHTKSWLDLEFTVTLEPPYPTGYMLSVRGELDEDDQAPYFCVYVLSPGEAELWHVESSGNQNASLSIAIEAALDRFSSEPDCWTDESLEAAFEMFCDIETDYDGALSEEFLHFGKGTYYEHVHDWFDQNYSNGISGLLNLTEETFIGMDNDELKTAVCALLDAYINLSQRYCCSHDQIADSLADIFEPAQLTWLGYHKYTLDSNELPTLKPAMKDLMYTDLVGPVGLDEEDCPFPTNPMIAARSEQQAPSGPDFPDFDEDIFDPDGQCLTCEHLEHFYPGTGKCKTCLNHGGSEDNFTVIGSSSGNYLYPDGSAEILDNIYQAGSGTFSHVEKTPGKEDAV